MSTCSGGKEKENNPHRNKSFALEEIIERSRRGCLPHCIRIL
jgi:hypothetical protein